LVEMMGGIIDVDSELGRGSTFIFLVAFEKYRPEPASQGDARAKNGAVTLTGCRVLIVDDVSVNGAITSEYLDLLGCRSEVCARLGARGKRGGAGGVGDPFRIVLLDINPPAPEVFKLNRAIASDPAIAQALRICCTESAVRGESRLKEFGFAASIHKPVTPA